MDAKDLKSVIETLNQDLEEKIHQMSQVSMIARTMVTSLNDPDHFTRICKDFLETFDAEICCLYWFRRREPAGWWLDSWASVKGNLKPVQNLIPEQEEGLLGWVKKQKKPSYQENVADEPIIQVWGSNSPLQSSLALVPLIIDENRDGMLVIFNPMFRLSAKNIKFQLDILSDMINTDVRNRLLYKGIKDSEEEFKDLLDNSVDMVVLAYPDGVIRDCNRIFIDSLGLTDDIKGTNLTELIIDESEPPFDDCWENLLSGEDVKDFKVSLKTAEGEKLESILNGSVRATPDGRIGIVILYFSHVSDHVRTTLSGEVVQLDPDMALRHQFNQMQLFVSGLANHLLSPVQGLMNFLNQSRKVTSIPTGIEQMTETLGRIAEVMHSMLSKELSEKKEDLSSIDINGLLQSELTHVTSKVEYGNINWNYDLDRHLPIIRARWRDLSQSILNVLYNAIEAVQDSDIKEININTKYDQDRELITISIVDTGTGIAEDIRHRIFDPFFSTKSLRGGAGSEIASGSGLGLADSERLLKTYGGSINFDSQFGQGSTFNIVLPIKAQESNI